MEAGIKRFLLPFLFKPGCYFPVSIQLSKGSLENTNWGVGENPAEEVGRGKKCLIYPCFPGLISVSGDSHSGVLYYSPPGSETISKTKHSLRGSTHRGASAKPGMALHEHAKFVFSSTLGVVHREEEQA